MFESAQHVPAGTRFDGKIAVEEGKAWCGDDAGAGAAAVDWIIRKPGIDLKLQGSYVGGDGVAFEIGSEGTDR